MWDIFTCLKWKSRFKGSFPKNTLTFSRMYIKHIRNIKKYIQLEPFFQHITWNIWICEKNKINIWTCNELVINAPISYMLLMSIHIVHNNKNNLHYNFSPHHNTTNWGERINHMFLQATWNQPLYFLDLLFTQCQRAVKVSPALFCMHQLTDVCNWLVSLWLTGQSDAIPPTQKVIFTLLTPGYRLLWHG